MAARWAVAVGVLSRQHGWVPVWVSEWWVPEWWVPGWGLVLVAMNSLCPTTCMRQTAHKLMLSQRMNTWAGTRMQEQQKKPPWNLRDQRLSSTAEGMCTCKSVLLSNHLGVRSLPRAHTNNAIHLATIPHKKYLPSIHTNNAFDSVAMCSNAACGYTGPFEQWCPMQYEQSSV
eukprot:m.174285 g.174285  ORF g.174285 m.174285 type:complete len:173 (-) comp18327_c0_seq6:2147-2665(-)